jgi:hypothetical protein
MVTGDNLLTAMSVARECGIIRPNKKAFLLEATNNKSSTGKTLLSLRQSVSSSEEVVCSYFFPPMLRLALLQGRNYRLGWAFNDHNSLVVLCAANKFSISLH